MRWWRSDVVEALMMQRVEEGRKCKGCDVAPIGASGEQNALVGDVNAKYGVRVTCSEMSGDNAQAKPDQVIRCGATDKRPTSRD